MLEANRLVVNEEEATPQRLAVIDKEMDEQQDKEKHSRYFINHLVATN